MSEFDWVNARARCSLTQVFEQLRLDIERDVAKRQDLRSKDDFLGGYSHGFEIAGTPDKFSVSLRGRHFEPRSVIFALEEDAISIEDADKNTAFRMTVTLNDEGRCVAKVGGQEMEFWQVRAKALEALFFEMRTPFNTPAS